MLNAVPQKENEGKYSSERKDKRGGRKRSKKPSVDVSKNVNIKYTNKSRPDGRNKNGQAGKTESQASPGCSLVLGQEESAWNPEKNAAESLFPNVESVVNEEESEEEMLRRAISESLETAFLEKCAIDPPNPQDEAAEELAEYPEDEDTWNKVQRNLPSPEPEKEGKTSDANNNSGHHSIENLTIPDMKLELRRRPVPGAEQDTKDQGGITYDRYGRINGCSEKHIFMGKGARLKEQEYLKQQQQQQRLLDGINVADDLPSSSRHSVGSSRQISRSSEVSRASSKDSLYEPKKAASSQGSSQDLVQPTMQPPGPSEASNLAETRDQTTKEVATELKEIMDWSQDVAALTQLASGLQVPSRNFARPMNPLAEEFKIPLRQLAKESEDVQQAAFSQNENTLAAKQPSNLSESSRASSRASAGAKKETASLSSETRDDYSRQDSGRSGRPILPGANCNNHPSTRYSTPGPWNSGKNPQDHFSGNDRGSRPEQFFNRTSGRGSAGSRGGHGGSRGRGDRFPQKSHEEGNRESYRNVRHEQNPHKFHAEPISDAQRGLRNEQNSYKRYAEQYRDVQRGPRSDQGSHRHDAEHNRGDANRAASRPDRGKYDSEGNRDVHRGQRNSQGSHRHDSHSNRAPRVDQNSHKSEAEQNRDANRAPRTDQNSHKSEADQNCDANRAPRVDQGSYKFEADRVPQKQDEEQNRELHRRAESNTPKSLETEQRVAQQNGRSISQVAVQELSVPVESIKQEPPTEPAAEMSIQESQKRFDQPIAKSEVPSFHEPNIEDTRNLHISELKSRYIEASSLLQAPDFPAESSIMPSVVNQPANTCYVAQAVPYSNANDAGCHAEEMHYRPQVYAAPPGFPALENPAMTSSCANCSPGALFKMKYASLQLTDPLLYKLLLQKQMQNPSTQTSVYPQTTMNLNEKPPSPKPYENWQRALLVQSAMSPYYSPYTDSVHFPEASNAPFVEGGSEWDVSARVQAPFIPINENLPFVNSTADPCSNSSAVRHFYVIGHHPPPYQNAPRTIHGLVPLADDCLRYSPTNFENFSPDVQRQMQQQQQRMLNMQFDAASGFSIPYGSHAPIIHPQMAMHLPPKHYGADHATVGQCNLGPGFTEAAAPHEPDRRADFNNQRSLADKTRNFQATIGAPRAPTDCSRVPNFAGRIDGPRIPVAGRGRARMPQNN